MSKVCEYVYTRGKRAGRQCDVCPKSGNLCNEHKDRKVKKVANLENDEVFGQSVKAPREKAPKSSVWTITCVLNTPFDKLGEKDKKNFKNFIEFTFDKSRILDYISDQASPDDSARNIVEIECDHAFELAPNTGLVHSHALLSVKHHGFIRLRLNDIRAVAHKIFNKNLYINAPVSNDYQSAYRAYMMKNQGPNKVSL